MCECLQVSESLESRISRVRFSMSNAGADRVYYVTEEDIRVVLSRLPIDVWQRLRAVHFNDQSRGARVLGYVDQGHREIALCALPPRMSLTGFLVKGQTPQQFGAQRGQRWPHLAIRRFLIYDVFLHELGHLQVIDANRPSERLRYAREKLAQAFAMRWCKRLWATPFLHPDPVHHPPTASNL